jgi:hypothetical protein
MLQSALVHFPVGTRAVFETPRPIGDAAGHFARLHLAFAISGQKRPGALRGSVSPSHASLALNSSRPPFLRTSFRGSFQATCVGTQLVGRFHPLWILRATALIVAFLLGGACFSGVLDILRESIPLAPILAQLPDDS